MKQIVGFETAVRVVLLGALLLSAAALPACSKKQDQAGRSSSETKSRGEELPRPKATVSGPTADANRPGQVRQALSKRTARLLGKHKKTSRPVEANNAAETETPRELTLERFDSLAGADEKIDFITEFSDSHPESTAAIVDKALDDEDVNVRSAAMDALIGEESAGPEVLAVAVKALKDGDEQIRERAVEVCDAVNDPKVSRVLISALGDESETVRAAALQVADQKDAGIRLEVLKAGIGSPYEDVRSGAVTSLTDVSSPDAVDVLIAGLKDPDAEFREEVRLAISFLISREFETYEQAKSWWDANRNKFDDELFERDDE